MSDKDKANVDAVQEAVSYLRSLDILIMDAACLIALGLTTDQIKIAAALDREKIIALRSALLGCANQWSWDLARFANWLPIFDEVEE